MIRERTKQKGGKMDDMNTNIIYIGDGIELRAIPGYDCCKYRASGTGFIYSRVQNRKGLNPDCQGWYRISSKPNRDGYSKISLCTKVRRISENTHRLVAKAFHGMPTEEKPVTRHLNGIPSDNRPENLKWGTAQENRDDMIGHGTVMYGEKNHKSKFTEEDKVEVIRLWESGMSQLDIGRKYGVRDSSVHKVLKKAGCLNRRGCRRCKARLLPDERETIREFRKGGQSVAALALQFNISTDTIYTVCKEGTNV